MACDCQNSSTLTTGINGYNAFTVTTASYVQPAVSTNVTISVSNNSQYTGVWAVAGQTIYIDNGGYYIVDSVVSSTATSIVVKYESDYATFNQALTAAGNTVATNKKVSPAGKKGMDSSNTASIIYAYNNLTGVGNSAAVGEDTLGSYTILASELDVNNDELDFYIFYDYFENERVTIRLKLGGSTIYTYNEVGALDTNNTLKIKVARISNTSQIWTIEKFSSDLTKISSYLFVDDTSSAATLTNANLFEITADNLSIGANQVVLKKLVIKKDNA